MGFFLAYKPSQVFSLNWLGAANLKYFIKLKLGYAPHSLNMCFFKVY